MRISSIEIKNYRQYKSQLFDFDKKSSNDMHIIIASNGVGKTNFLNAITWCLYEDESHLGIKSKALPLLNIDSINELNEGESCEISVQIKFLFDGVKYVLKRAVQAQKRSERAEKIYLPPSSYELTIIDTNDPSKLPVQYENREAKEYMNRFLPEGINEYFFFDNEQLDQYFINNESQTIQTAIKELSQVEMLERAKRHLNEVMNEYRNIVKRNNPDLEKLQIDVDNAQYAYDSRIENIADLNRQIAESKKIISDNKIILKGAPNIKEIEDELDDIKKQIETTNNDLRNSKKEIHEFIRRYNVLLRMYPDLYKTLAIIEDQEEKGNLPMEISLELLKDMIDTKHCRFCDSDLTKEALININSMIDKIKFSNKTSSLLMTIKSEIIRLINEAKQYPLIKDKVWKKYNNLQSKKDELETLRNIKRDTIATRADSKELKTRLLENEKHESLMKQNEEELVLDKQRLIKSDELLRKAKESYDRALQKSTKNNETKELLKFSQGAYDVLDESYTELINEMKSTITKRTYTTFSSLVWKKNTYNKVMIDDNYNLDLIHEDGYSCIGSCSAAERALLALSFTLSLHKVSGFDAPLVIDSPVGRVSDVNRENFGKVLTDVSKSKQIIMLFTPSEYSEEVKPLFEKNASNIFFVESVDERASQIIGGNI